MVKHIIVLGILLGIPWAAVPPQPQVDVSGLSGDSIPVVPYVEPEPEPDETWRQFVPPLEHLTMDSKSYCDEKVGITEAYRAGRDPSWGQWQWFDWCQRSINRQQGIGVYKTWFMR